MTPQPPVLERVRAGIQASVRQTYIVESRRNELKLAYGRAILVGSSSTLAWLFDFVIPWNPLPEEWIDDVMQAGFFAVSLLFVLLLRCGWYWRGLRYFVPIVDSCMMLAYFGLVVYLRGPVYFQQYDTRAALAVFCAMLTLTGCARLSAKVVCLTASLSVAIYLAITGWVGWVQIDAFAAAGLIAIGYLAIWLVEAVRRATENELARNVLSRFLSETIVEYAHGAPQSLLAEPRLVELTVLVTDIRGFTSFAERAELSVVFRVLNEIQGAMADVVRKHAGTVDKFTGDGMLAVFGLSKARSHASDALHAVRDIRLAAQGVRDSHSPYLGFDLRVGIGIHSGPVQVGCVGSETRLEFTVIGDAVNTAFRLQELTKELKVDVLVSRDTVALAGDTESRFRPLGATPIRGRDQALEILMIET